LVAYYSPTVFAFFFFIIRPPPSSTLFPYTTLFRSLHVAAPPTGLLLAPPPGDQCGPGPQRRPGERPERTLPPGRAELHEVAIDALGMHQGEPPLPRAHGAADVQDLQLGREEDPPTGRA